MAFTRHEREGIVYFTIPSFDDTEMVKHCFSTRVGGVSCGQVKGLNLGFSRPDARENVIANFERLCGAVGIDKKTLVFSHQVHGTTIRRVTREDAGKGIWRDSDIRNTDGLITDEKEVTLTTFYADCVPLFFLDPIKRAIGLAHAGWKGTVAKIAQVTLSKMKEAFGSQPVDMLVGIGPSICRDCYEVDTPVIERLREDFENWRDVTVVLGKERYLLDLQLTNSMVLQKVGVREKNITGSGLCTRCCKELFYSYRREEKNTGSLAALLQLV
jgi:YfiH family protein